MDTNTSDNINSTPTSALLSAQTCIPWVVLMTTESLFIVIFNLLTIIVFAWHRQLHRRRAYLLIRNLAIIDLFVGGISGPLQIEWNVGDSCDLWMYNRMTSSWFFFLKISMLHLFSMASLCNLAAISLERMHAIICPSRHLFMKKLVYKVTIAVIWLIAILRECAQIVIIKVTTRGPRKTEILMNFTIYIPYYIISLLIICLCYTIIFIKIRYSSPPQPLRSSVIIKERQLTKTLFVVTVASLLTLLPVIIFLGLETFSHDPVIDRSSSLYGHIKFAVTVFFLANSLANPIIYAMRMQKFRLGLKELFGRDSKYEVALPFRQK